MAFNYSPKIVTDGLVLYLDAANSKSYVSGSTTWSDVSGNGNNGTLVNGPGYSSANNGSIVFDGVDDYVSYPTITFTNQPYTLEMWGKLPGPIDSSNRRTIFTRDSDIGEFSNTSVFRTTFILDSATTFLNFNFSTAGTIQLNIPFHWVFTLDSSKQVMMYLNGNPTPSANTQLTSYTNIVSSYNRFGLRGSNARRYNGNLNINRIYNRALSQQEITQNYNALKGRFGL